MFNVTSLTRIVPFTTCQEAVSFLQVRDGEK
jgi:hypothetical protein